MNRWRVVLPAIALAACVAGLAGCESNSSADPPAAVVENYLNALGGGNYSGACGLIAARARQAPLKKIGHGMSCPRLFVRCLPKNVIRLAQDPTQLYYSNVDVTGTGSSVSVAVSGTAVASAIRSVTVAKQPQGVWKLTSYGKSIANCRLLKPRHGKRAGKG
jgi:hypothetical protein